MFKGQYYFQGLDLGLLEIVALLNILDVRLLFEQLVFANKLGLGLLLGTDLDWEYLLKILLQGLKLLWCYSDDCSIYCQSDATDKFRVFSIPIDDELQEKVCSTGRIRLKNCGKRHIMFKFILYSDIMNDKFISLKVWITCSIEIDAIK